MIEIAEGVIVLSGKKKHNFRQTIFLWVHRLSFALPKLICRIFRVYVI